MYENRLKKRTLNKFATAAPSQGSDYYEIRTVYGFRGKIVYEGYPKYSSVPQTILRRFIKNMLGK